MTNMINIANINQLDIKLTQKLINTLEHLGGNGIIGKLYLTQFRVNTFIFVRSGNEHKISEGDQTISVIFRSNKPETSAEEGIWSLSINMDNDTVKRLILSINQFVNDVNIDTDTNETSERKTETRSDVYTNIDTDKSKDDERLYKKKQFIGNLVILTGILGILVGLYKIK